MGKFEDKWKVIFDDAGVEPSDSVWSAIDRKLANEDGVAMKKRVILYQRVAAASILFAILVGSFGIYHWRENNRQLAQISSLKNELPAANQKIAGDGTHNATAKTSENKKEPISLNRTTEKHEVGVTTSKSDRTSRAAKKIREAGINSQELKSVSENEIKRPKKTIGNEPNQVAVAEAVTWGYKADIPHLEAKKPFEIELKDLPEPGLASVPGIHKGPVLAEIFRRLPAIPGVFMNKRGDKINHEKMWASVSAAAGSFGTGSNLNSGTQAASSSTAAGNSYSLAMLGGVRVARRIVLQSGIQYTNESAGSEVNVSPSTFTVMAAAPKAHTKTLSAFNIASVSSSSTLNTNEFVSVPVQAGYLFVDKRIGLQLNSGMSTDFFVRNTVSDQSGQQPNTSQGAGQNSPYRTVNFSGLMNSEVSCRLGDRYRVSLVPGFRYSFNSILKANEGTLGNQWMWDVGFRFRYIFR